MNKKWSKWLIPLGLLLAYVTGSGSLKDFLTALTTAAQGIENPERLPSADSYKN